MPFSGLKLRQLREKAGLDRHQLAEKSGTTNAYISHLENGIRGNPAFDLVERLADALGVTCSDFREDVATNTEPAPQAPAPAPPAPKAKKKPKK